MPLTPSGLGGLVRTLPLPIFVPFTQQFDRPVGQRNSMRCPLLCSMCLKDPKLPVQIVLTTCHLQHFTCTRSGENKKLESHGSGRIRLTRTKFLNKSAVKNSPTR